MSQSDKKDLYFYKADVSSDEIFFGSELLGGEEYVGVINKDGNLEHVLFTKNKEGTYKIRSVFQDGTTFFTTITGLSLDDQPGYDNHDIITKAHQLSVPLSQLSPTHVSLDENMLMTMDLSCVTPEKYEMLKSIKEKNPENSVQTSMKIQNLELMNATQRQTIEEQAKLIEELQAKIGYEMH